MAFHDSEITRMKNNQLLIWLRKLSKRLFKGTLLANETDDCKENYRLPNKGPKSI